MAGTPQVNVTEATGVSPLPDSEIPSRVAVIAPAYAGTLEPRAMRRCSEVESTYTVGPLHRAASHLIGRTRIPNIAVRCAATNPGTYNAIDNSAKTGTCVPAVDSSTVPRGEYEGYWLIKDGGTIGTSGITYYEADDNGRLGLSGLKKLGTSTYFELATQGIKINLDPPLATLLTYVNELVDEFEDHIGEGATIHGTADTGPYTIGATAATQAAAITRFNQMLTAAKLHVVKTASSIHGAADTTAQTALNAIVTPTTGQTLITAALAFATAFFGDGATLNSGHTLRTASSIHGAQDTTNVIVSDDPVRGTFVAGDIIRATTEAPYPSTSELAAAFTALAASDLTPGMILLPWRVTAAYASTIITGLNNLEAAGKPCGCIIQSRKPSSETDQEHRDTVETEWDGVNDSRLYLIVGEYLCTFTDGEVTRQYLTNYATQVARRTVEREYFDTTWKPADGSLEDVSMTDANGVLVGHEEPQDVETRVQVMYRVPSPRLGRPHVLSVDKVLAGPSERVKEFRVRRITDELNRIVREWAWSKIGVLAKVDVINSTSGTLAEETRVAFQRECAALIEQQMSAAISDVNESDLVAIDPNVTLDGSTVYLDVTVNYTPVMAVGRIDIELSVRTSS